MVVSWLATPKPKPAANAERLSMRAPRREPATSNQLRGREVATSLAVSPVTPATASVAPANGEGHVPPSEPKAQDYVERARAEARDESWAGPTERVFEEDLKAKAQRLDFRVGSVECYDHSCVAELFWSSLREARADFKEALAAPERTGCRPRLLLTEDGHEDASEMGVMVLHCKAKRQRAARMAGVPVAEDDDEM
jgi:hypothetical protein